MKRYLALLLAAITLVALAGCRNSGAGTAAGSSSAASGTAGGSSSSGTGAAAGASSSGTGATAGGSSSVGTGTAAEPSTAEPGTASGSPAGEPEPEDSTPVFLGFFYLTEDNRLLYSRDGTAENTVVLTSQYLAEPEKMDIFSTQFYSPRNSVVLRDVETKSSTVPSPELLQNTLILLDGGEKLLLVSQIDKNETGRLELVDLSGNPSGDPEREFIDKDVLAYLEPAAGGAIYQSEESVYFVGADGKKIKLVGNVYGKQVAGISAPFYIEEYRQVRKLEDGTAVLVYDRTNEVFYTLALTEGASRTDIPLSVEDIHEILNISDNGTILFYRQERSGTTGTSTATGGHSYWDELDFEEYGRNRNGYYSGDPLVQTGADGETTPISNDVKIYLAGNDAGLFYMKNRLESRETDHPADCIDRQAYDFLTHGYSDLVGVYWDYEYNGIVPEYEVLKEGYENLKHFLDELLRTKYCYKSDVTVWSVLESAEASYGTDTAEGLIRCVGRAAYSDLWKLVTYYQEDYAHALQAIYVDGTAKCYVTDSFWELYFWDGAREHLLADNGDGTVLAYDTETGRAVYTYVEDGVRRLCDTGSGKTVPMPEDFRMTVGFLPGSSELIYCSSSERLVSLSLDNGKTQTLSEAFRYPTFDPEQNVLYFYDGEKEDRANLCSYSGGEVVTLAKGVTPQPYASRILKNGVVFAISGSGVLNRYENGKEQWIADKVTYFIPLSETEVVYLSGGDVFYFNGEKAVLAEEGVRFVWGCAEAADLCIDDVWMKRYNSLYHNSYGGGSVSASSPLSIFGRRHC